MTVKLTQSLTIFDKKSKCSGARKTTRRFSHVFFCYTLQRIISSTRLIFIKLVSVEHTSNLFQSTDYKVPPSMNERF